MENIKNEKIKTSREESFINLISKIFARSKNQKNILFESDSELLDIQNKLMAFNIDEYSSKEDFFSSLDPKILGYNLVAATISDLYATGSTPQYLLHAITIANNWDNQFIETFLTGINEALNFVGAYLIGGDTSTDDDWKYTAVIFGENIRPIKRSGANVGDIIFSSNTFGAGNRQALLQLLSKSNQIDINSSESIKKLSTPKFLIQKEIFQALSQFATFAIDSSDGYFNSFKYLKKVNANIGFNINCNKELIDQESLYCLDFTKLPWPLFLFGSLGEYNLIFGIKRDDVINFEKTLNLYIPKHSVIKIGEVVANDGIFLNSNYQTDFNNITIPDPRANSPEEYLKQMIHFITSTIK